VGFLAEFARDEGGQNVLEYGLLIATIAIVVLLATAAFGAQVQTWFSGLAGRITTT
jgi:Flp pilus assembly pilin Flp